MTIPLPGVARRRRAAGLVAAAAALLALAAPAPAGAVVNMYYKGSLIIQSFGNDTTTGTVYPYSQYIVLGVPFGLECNPNYGPSTNDCAASMSLLWKGAPLTGSGVATLTMTGKAGFKLKVAPTLPVKTPGPTGFGLRRTTTGSFSYVFPYIYSYTTATLRNDAGSFFAGGGPDSFSLPYKIGKNTQAKLVVTAGPNKFGGVMKLLGGLNTRYSYFRNGGQSRGTINWRYDAVGATPYTVAGMVTGAYIATATGTAMHTQLMQTVTVLAKGSRMPWTTGMATVTAVERGPFPTIERRAGYDNRTAGGLGTIQLVSPLLTHWLQPGFNYETGGIATLRIQFVPEPRAALLLVAGIAGLGILYRRRRPR